MIWTVQVFSAQTITSAGTATSTPFRSSDGRLCGFSYNLSTSTTGAYVAATAQVLVAADSALAYVLPVDSAGAAMSTLLINVNSNDRYIAYRFGDVPVAAWTQVRLLSSTNNTLTFDGVYAVYTTDVK